ncbi:unannotated protein [freshwater metagenome]|uniref:Unannotated protein n=1 Tax=freshwater metagenome TaxID=449393 RepID=A0A6J7J4K4_9ZZZZ
MSSTLSLPAVVSTIWSVPSVAMPMRSSDGSAVFSPSSQRTSIVRVAPGSSVS